MKYFDWSIEKNELLKIQREIGFAEILDSLFEDGLLVILDHPNKKKYPSQKIFLIKIRDYVYLVPFIENEEKVFLKTIIPSRKMTKKYLKLRR